MASGRTSPLWIAAAAVGFALLLTRFAYLGLAPFLREDAQLLLAAWEQIETGSLAAHSPLAGIGSLQFGATPLWFFAIVQGLIGKQALGVIAAVTAIACACQLAFMLVLHARCSLSAPRPYLALAGVLIVAASSPYEFFWSRSATDLITNLGPFVALAILALDDFGPVQGALLGLVLGLCISAHPLIAPFALACLCVLLLAPIRQLGQRALTLAAACVALLLTNLPWLNYLRQAEQLTLPELQRSSWQLTPERLLETYRPHSFWGLSQFFDGDWSSFAASHPLLTRPDVQRASLALAAFVTLSGLLALAWQKREPGLRRVALVGVLCAFAYPLSFWILQFDDQPRYQFPVVWLTVAGAAGIFYARSRWMVPLRVLALALAAVNLSFIAAWGGFIHAQTGTRGAHYGTPVAEQTRFMRAACAAPGRVVHIDNDTAMHAEPFEQHFKSETKCRGKKLDLCAADGCQSVPPNDPILRLHYRDAVGGALAWVLEPRRPPSPTVVEQEPVAAEQPPAPQEKRGATRRGARKPPRW